MARDLKNPLGGSSFDPPIKKKSIGVLKSDTKKEGPKLENKQPFSENGINYVWDRKHSVYRGDL